MLDIERFGQHATGDDTAACDHDHRLKVPQGVNLRDHLGDQVINVLP
jgi:hypothetical protein